MRGRQGLKATVYAEFGRFVLEYGSASSCWRARVVEDERKYHVEVGCLYILLRDAGKQASTDMGKCFLMSVMFGASTDMGEIYPDVRLAQRIGGSLGQRCAIRSRSTCISYSKATSTRHVSRGR